MNPDSRRQIQRIVRQRLESLERAGVDRLPRPAAVVDAVAVDAVAVEVRDEYGGAAEPVGIGSPSSRESGTVRSPSPVTSPPPPDQTTVTEIKRSTLSREKREAGLKALAECVAGCDRCSELAATRTQTVFGVGNPEAKIMFIGEAPGADEDQQGEPFVGRAGQLLDRIITACNLAREDIYICNILRCRPPSNRNPTADEAHNCREYLDGQIQLVDPDYIVCWGSVAAQNLLDTTVTIGRLRGKFYNYGRAKVACTYHPSYLLRNPSAKKEVWRDMKFVMADMGIDLD